MKRLFTWLLQRFLAAFIILVAVQLVTYILGLNIILSGYEKGQLKQFERLAVEILANPEQVESSLIPDSNPFFVFSSDKELVFSNKGKGRSISVDEYRPVYFEEKIAGYFYAGDLHFADNQANRVFLVSVILLGGLSLILSVVIGLFFALFSSKRIAEPVGLIRTDIHAIRSLKNIPQRSFEIRELAEISSDVSEVSLTLSSQEEYKQQWLRDLAHDLRTPLSGLKSQLEAMADGVLEPVPGRLRRNLQEIERLEHLVSSIGELTNIESLKTVERNEIKVDKFVSRLVSSFEIDIKQKNIDFKVTVDADTLYGDEQLLLRAVGNILSNAVKYIEENGKISMRFRENRIEIENNGPDISEEQLHMIFTRLYRGEASRTTPGSGLGLSISREIVNLHGGEIVVEPVSPRGVRFIVNLPGMEFQKNII